MVAVGCREWYFMILILPCLNSVLTWILGTLCIVFQSFLFIAFKVIKPLLSKNSVNMGGDRNHAEPFSCKVVKKKTWRFGRCWRKEGKLHT